MMIGKPGSQERMLLVPRASVEETGVQQQYLRAVHDRLKLELSGKLPALQSKWLLGHLKISD